MALTNCDSVSACNREERAPIGPSGYFPVRDRWAVPPLKETETVWPISTKHCSAVLRFSHWKSRIIAKGNNSVIKA